jgi:AAA15 family ATPase/GTPase
MKNDADDSLLISVNDNMKLLKFGVLYGYNASGKSNILLAFDVLRNLALDGPRTKDGDTSYEPFALDKRNMSQPSEFSLVFFIHTIRYSYDIAITKKTILWEKLYFSPEGRKTCLYTRHYDEKAKVAKTTFGKATGLLAKDKLVLNGNTLGNSSVLYAYQKTNIHSEELEKVVSFFKHSIMPLVTPKTNLLDWSLNKLDKDKTKRKFFISLMKKADFQISNLEIQNESKEISDKMIGLLESEGAPKVLVEQLKKEKKIDVKKLLFEHSLQNGIKKSFPVDEESEGTRRYFGLGGVLNELLKGETFLAIDELETSLHSDLVSFFLKMFLLNSKTSQLFVTTHEQFLMDKDYMRNDMVWFCEKEDDGSSTYYQAQDFKLHKNVSLANFYRSGKFGAVPELGNPVIGEVKK